MKIKTQEQLDKLRKKMIALSAGTGEQISEFTCDDCDVKERCQFVFDLYNTDGDCLAMK